MEGRGGLLSNDSVHTGTIVELVHVWSATSTEKQECGGRAMREYTTIHVDYVAASSGQVRSVIEKRGVCSIFSLFFFSLNRE